MASRTSGFRGWVWSRLRLVGGGAAVGAIAGVVATASLTVYARSTAFGTRKAFALGALALGFAVIGWSGSVMAGRGVENLHRYVEGGTDWTERDSRRAMARIVGFGAGMMLGVGLVATLV